MNISDANMTFFLDKDNSPFILFDHSGTIRYLNDAAEVLLAYADTHELFQLALTYAPKDFGSRTTPLELHYQQLRFYALTVAYENEELIGIRLYYRPHSDTPHAVDAGRLKYTNINTLLEAAITHFSLQNTPPLELLTDADLPECKLDQNSFSKLLRKSLHLFRASARLRIALTLAVGESIILDHKRYPIVRLKIEADSRYQDSDRSIRTMAEEMRILAACEENSIVLDIPFIRD
jgi:hypothetical protein